MTAPWLVSAVHLNSAKRESLAALASSDETFDNSEESSGQADKLPVLAQSCRTSNVLIAMFLAPTKSA
jgi:hypothetical protein